MNQEDGSGNVRLERQVRRCQICGGADGTMVNYSIGRGELMMHPVCAARHFQHALELVADLITDTNSLGEAVDIANEALG